MREIFTRVEEGVVSTIEVEIDADEHKSDSPWLFSVFVKFDGTNETIEGYEEFLETKESLIIAIEYDGKAHYLGSRVVDGWSEFYFCATSAKELNSIVAAIFKESGYVYESNSIKDKKWNFYETQLFPTELEFIHLQSDKIIFLLQEEGDNLETPRDVEHYVSFSTPTQKEKFLAALSEGFVYKDDLSSDEFENGVAIVKNHAVSTDVVKNIVDGLYQKVKEHQAYYEGWSTTLVASTEEP